MHRLIILACFFCLTVSAALSQDVVTVAGGPETHRVILDNAEVRVLDVHIPPGQKIAMHSHPANVVYFATDGKFKFTFPDGTVRVVDAKAGTAVWRDPGAHAVENIGTTEFHFVQTELKGESKPEKK
jgi:beta-alanine degradation protein BauB